MAAFEPGHEMCGQEPRRGLDPDPIVAAGADLPSAQAVRRSPRIEAQTEQPAPDELTALTRDILDRGTKPLLR